MQIQDLDCFNGYILTVHCFITSIRILLDTKHGIISTSMMINIYLWCIMHNRSHKVQFSSGYTEFANICIPTCTYKTGSSTMYKVIIVRQYERTPLLDLKTVLFTGNLMTAAWLRTLEILSAEPGLVDSLQREQERNKQINRVNERKPLNFQTPVGRISHIFKLEMLFYHTRTLMNRSWSHQGELGQISRFSVNNNLNFGLLLIQSYHIPSKD